MLFNLQGAHRSQRRAFILPQLISFVKHFFQVFSNFFVLSFAGSSPCFAVLADSLIRLPHSVFFVKHFFKFFQTFLCSSRKNLRGDRCPRRQLIEDITVGIICQALFSSFPNWFSSAGPVWFLAEILKRLSLRAFRAPCRKRSLIIAKSLPLVNTFFQVFSIFFWGPYICSSSAFFLTRYAFLPAHQTKKTGDSKTKEQISHWNDSFSQQRTHTISP